MAVLSRYNVKKTIDEDTWLLNTLTSAFVKLPTEEWKKIASGKEDEETAAQLKAMGFKVDSHEDEVRAYKYRCYSSAFAQKTLSLSVAPTMKCNFACAYCFEGGNKTMPTMNDEVAEKLVRFIEKNGKDSTAINWFGGEPLLAFDRIVALTRALEEKNVNFTASMVTNGSCLTPDKLERMKSLHLRNVQVSMDGTAKHQDKRRFFRGGKPSFEIVRNNIDHFLRETDIRMTIQVTVDRANATAYEDLLEEFGERYAPYIETQRLQIGCNPVQNRTGFDDKLGNCFSSDEIAKEKLACLENGVVNDKTPGLPRPSMPCMYRSAGQYAIDPEGNMYRCLEHLGNRSKRVGNVAKGQMSLEALARTAFEDDPFEDERCLECNVFPICGGGCPIDRVKARSAGNHDACCSLYKKHIPDFLPALYNRYFKP